MQEVENSKLTKITLATKHGCKKFLFYFINCLFNVDMEKVTNTVYTYKNQLNKNQNPYSLSYKLSFV